MVIVCTLFDVFAAALNQSYREARAPCFSGVVFVTSHRNPEHFGFICDLRRTILSLRLNLQGKRAESEATRHC